jgi:hypothetical protein
MWYRYVEAALYGGLALTNSSGILTKAITVGILSMFCAKAGARKVLAVDNSAIIDKARQNVFDNGLSGIITCVKGRIEDVKLPVEEVDIIISEWMGYCLLYEAMLPSVIWARDRYLKPDGLLVPSTATLWAAPVFDGEYVADNISFWEDVYGFKMKAMQEGVFEEAEVTTLPTTSLCGEPFPIAQLPLHDVGVKDLSFTTSWSTKLNRDVPILHGFLVWFDMYFVASRNDRNPTLSESAQTWRDNDRSRIAFTTGPFGQETHWKQGFLFISPLEADTQGYKSGLEISGETAFSALEGDSRALSIKVTWKSPGRESRSQVWTLR